MSFPPLNNTSDYDVYTTKYLQSLALQIQLNQNNFDKNVGFMKTGVQDTERTDSRSIEERAADVEKLKVQARVMLNKLTDATNTNEVLNYLAKNGEILFFFIQQFPAIEKIVKEQYTGGIRAPILISLIYKRFISQQEDSLMPESADFDIVSNLMTSEDVENLVNQTKNPELKRQLNSLASVLPTQQEIKRLIDNPAGNKDEIKFVAEMFKNSPNVKDYNKLTEEYNDAPLKDESTNYDLEQAEDMMIEIITSFLVERKSFQEDKYNQRTMRQIDKTNLKRATKPLPVAKNTRIAPTSEQQRATTKGRRQTVEDIKESQYALYPSTTKVSELSPAEQLKVEKDAQRRNNLMKDISEPRPIFSTADLLKPTKTRRRPTVAERVQDAEEQQAIEDAMNDRTKKQLQISDNTPKTTTYSRKETERKQEAKEKEDREIQRIINEMEELKREKKQEENNVKKLKEEQNTKEEQLDKIKAFQKKYQAERAGRAGSKISTFVSKQQKARYEKMSKLEDELKDDIDELEEIIAEGGEDADSKKQELQQKKEELATKRRARGPDKKGTRVRRTKAQIESDKAQKVSSTGKGLLNQQEQLSHRFKVLKGEILAGNTASQVIKEMRSLVKRLASSQELTIDQANGILKELKTL